MRLLRYTVHTQPWRTWLRVSEFASLYSTMVVSARWHALIAWWWRPERRQRWRRALSINHHWSNVRPQSQSMQYEGLTLQRQEFKRRAVIEESKLYSGCCTGKQAWDVVYTIQNKCRGRSHAQVEHKCGRQRGKQSAINHSKTDIEEYVEYIDI